MHILILTVNTTCTCVTKLRYFRNQPYIIANNNYATMRRFKKNVSQPVYVNIIREPLDRLVSWFYYRRANSPLRKHLLGNSRRNMVRCSQYGG